MPHIKLTHVQEYLGQTMMNRYFYFTSTPITVSILNDLMASFNTTMVPVVNRLQIVGVSNTRLDTIDLQGVSFSSLNLTGGGLNSGENSPSWNALSFLLQRGDASTKSGGKRIGGISEANIIGNIVFPDPTYEGWIDDYATNVATVLTGALANYVPELIKFDPVNPNVILASQNIAGASFSGLSTQNTRKPE